MARIRTLKPEFWTDGKIVQLPVAARLLFIGSWNFARCDHGHLDDDALALKLRVLPADNVNAQELLDTLIAAGLIDRRTTAGRTYLHIRRFTEHQKVETRWNNRCPYCAIEANHAEPRASLGEIDETPANSPQEGKGREGKGKERKSPENPPREDVEELCSTLADAIVANGSRKPAISKSWRDSARLLLDKDQVPLDEALRVLRWCQSDDFWKANILSLPKFRDKFDTLRLQSQRSPLRAVAGSQLPDRDDYPEEW